MNKRILFLGCHLDDIEFGCGALISKICRERMQYDIHLLTLSEHNEDSRGEVTIARDIDEHKLSCSCLMGCTITNDYIEKIPGQKFQYYTQDIREILIDYRNKINPDYVFFPSINDIHQDHEVLARESQRIFRDASCFGYEIVRSTKCFRPNIFVQVSNEDVERKIDAILKYKSQQKESAAYYFSGDVIRGISLHYGGQCGKKYVEAFEAYSILL